MPYSMICTQLSAPHTVAGTVPEVSTNGGIHESKTEVSSGEWLHTMLVLLEMLIEK